MELFPLLKGSSLKVESEVHPYSQLKAYDTDIAKHLEISESQDAKTKLYHYHVKLKKDLYFNIKDENYSYEEESRPVLNIATTPSYLKMSRELVTQYMEKIAQPLPREFKSLVKGLKGKSLEEQAATLMARMMDRLRYSGDWRTVEGALVPRNKADIAKTGYGDCKDFSLLLASLLRELGYDAHQALVQRDEDYQVDLYDLLPSVQSFNHAITHVKYKGKSFWFDPTNRLSFSKRPLADISGRKSLVMASKPFVAEIPKIKPEENIILITEEINFARSS